MNRPAQSMNYKTAFFAAIFVIAVLSIGLFFFWRKFQAHPPVASPESSISSPASTMATPATESPLVPVQLTPERMQSIGVKLAKAQMQNITDDIRAAGNVEVDERLVSYVQTRFPGWIRQVYANAWMTVREDEIRLVDGSESIYGVVDKPTYALVIPRDGDRLHLVEQFRYPVGRRRWEFPAGTAPERADVDPATLAVRELREETGLEAGRIERIGFLEVAPGMSSQRGHVFLATELTAGPPQREHSEQDMRTAWFTTAEFEDMARAGELADSQSLAAYLLLQLHDRAG